MELLSISLPVKRTECAVEGCGRKLHGKTYCRRHYQRLKEYGRLDKVVYGQTKHPLYAQWNKAKQEKLIGEAWLDFRIFIKDVGDKPKDTYLSRPDLTKPFGPNNFKWKSKLSKLEGETEKDRLKRVRKELRKANPDYGREQNYKYNFGMTVEQYDNKLKAQNFVCEICKEPETSISSKNGKIKLMSIDHCHKTNKIRDLLCSRCNLVLGRSKENIEILQNMITYIKKHK